MLRALLDTVAMARCIDRRIAWSNDGFGRLLGHGREELLGLAPSSLFVDPREAQRFMRRARVVLGRGRPFGGALLLRRRDGGQAGFDVTCTAPDASRDDVIVVLREQPRRAPLEDALAHAQAQLRATQRIARVGSWEWNPATGAVRWSEEMHRLYGEAPGDAPLAPSLCPASVHPADREATLAAFELSRSQRSPLELMQRVVDPSGNVRHLLVRGRVDKGRRGQPLLHVGTAQDVTSRIRKEQELEAGHARMEGIFTAMTEGVIVMSDKGCVVDANPAALTILGLDRRQLLAQSLARDPWQAVRPDGGRMPWEEFPLQRALRTGRPQRQQIVGVQHPVRGLRWLVVNAAPVKADEPERGVVATFSDVTERLAVEQALATSQQELREAQRIAGIGTWRWDQRTGWHLWSPEIYAMFGRDTALPPLGYPEILDHMAPESASSLERAVESCRTHHLPCQVDAEILRPDGSSRWVAMFGHPAPDITGRITQILWMLQDITDRKRLEHQLHQLAYFDALTNLPNRRMLADRLRQAMAMGRRHSTIGAVLYLDLDRFKPLNDRHGHEVGDLLLVECARRLLAGVREVDTVARLGGDEFVVLLPELGTEWQASQHAAEVVRQRLSNALARPYRLRVQGTQQAPGDIDYECAASIGLALFTGHEDDQDEILAQADLRMYEAKALRRSPQVQARQAGLRQ